MKKVHKCKKCGSKKDLTRHHLVPKMFSVYMRSPYYEKFNTEYLFRTVTLCRKCHDLYEEYADTLKYDICIQYGIAPPGVADIWVVDPLLSKLHAYAHQYFHKNATTDFKNKVINFFKTILNVNQITKKLIKRFKKIQYKYFNPKYNRYKDVIPTIDKKSFITLWRNDFYNWLNFA